MRSSFRALCLTSSLCAAVAVDTFVLPAQAACSTSDPQCSYGNVGGLKVDYMQEPSDPAVGFTWAQDFGASIGVSIGAGMYMKSKDGEPMFSVDMSQGAGPALEAYWAKDQKITMRFLDATAKSATLASHYGLAAEINFHAEALGADYDKTWDVQELLSEAGVGGEFDFDARNSLSFAPWAFAQPAAVGVVGGSIDSTTLFDVQLSSIGMPTDWAQGRFGGYISTEGTTVQYQTLGAKFDGVASAPGQDYVLPQKDEYGDELTVRLAVQGGFVVNGSLYAKPYIELSSIGSCSQSGDQCGYGGWPIRFSANTLSIHEDFRIPAAKDGSLPVEFPEATVTIPIPNVKPSKNTLSMAGKSGRLTITNTGTKLAKISFEAADRAFQLPGGELEIEAGGAYELQVNYSGSDQATTNVTLRSNDPDHPEQLISVGANGAPVSDPYGNDDDGSNGSSGSSGTAGIPDSEDESGCGCHTAGATPGSRAGFAVLLAGVLGALARLRRRR